MKTCSRCNLEKKSVAFPKEKSTVCNKCRVIANVEKSKKFVDKEDIGLCNLNSEAKEIKIISKYLVPTRFTSYDKALKKVEGVSYKVVDENTIYISEFIKPEKEDILTKINVLERDNYTCSYCDKDANTVDHKVPLSKGGESTEKNLVACCGECNVAKDNLILEKADVIVRVEQKGVTKKSKKPIKEEVVVDSFEDMLSKIMESSKQKWQ